MNSIRGRRDTKSMTPNLAEKLGALGIPIALSAPQVRERLKTVLKENHPDTTGGTFRTDEQGGRYQTARDALDLLDTIDSPSVSGREIQVFAENQTALAQTQSSLAKIIDEQRRQISALEQRQNVEASESKANSAITRSIQQVYTPIVFGGWGIAAIAAAIELLNRPLGGIIEEFFSGNVTAAHYAKLVLGLISIAGIILGFYAKWRSAREIELAKSIMTDAGIQHLFYRYDYYIFDDDPKTWEKVFSLSSLADGVAQHTKIRDRFTCEATAEAILKKLIQRGLAEVRAAKSFSSSYTIDRDLVENLYRDVRWDFDNRSLSEAVRSRFWRVLSKIRKKLIASKKE